MTLKIKSTHPETQGEFVIIDADQFDPDVHELWLPNAAPAPDAPAAKAPTVKELRKQLESLGVEFPPNASKDDLLALVTKQAS